MSNISKVNNKDTRTMSGAFINLEHISHFTVNISEFKQIHSSWAKEVPDNKLVLSNYKKFVVT